MEMRSVAWWPVVVVLAVATFTDLRSRRVPNWLVLPFLLLGVAVCGWQGGWGGILHSLAGLGLGALVFGIPCWMGGMGMGDVKLCAAIGAWIGPGQLILALVITAIAGGVIALGWALCGGFLGELLERAGNLLLGPAKGSRECQTANRLGGSLARKMPYVPAIAIGTLVSFFSH